MKLTRFGEKFSSRTGIQVLMEDLGHALSSKKESGNSDMLMLGGGNPAHIPALESYFQRRMVEIAQDPALLRKLIGVYDPPQGDMDFIRALVAMLNRRYDWGLKPENVALTNGSQSAFFMLFNMFGGECADGILRQIKLPLTPEYIGYSDAGLGENLFSAQKPKLSLVGPHHFKYGIDFDALNLGPDSGAMCVSRPTNPSGNVLTDAEMTELSRRARQADIPLIVDAAYGIPFPSLVYTAAQAHWDDNTILSMSLSKFGLPAARTGIVIAREDIVEALSRINAIINLATGSFGSVLATELVRRDELISLSETVVRPYYQSKAKRAEATLCTALGSLPYRLHVVEGAMFLWLWLEGLPISSEELYQRLKQRGVLVVPGHYFFPGLSDEDKAGWRHSQECIRISYAQDDAKVEQGLQLIAREVREIYQRG